MKQSESDERDNREFNVGTKMPGYRGNSCQGELRHVDALIEDEIATGPVLAD